MSRLFSVLALMGLVAAACGESPSQPDGERLASFAFIPGGTVVPAQVLGEAFVICKSGTDGLFRISEDTGAGIVVLGDVAVADGECRSVFQIGGEARTIISEELPTAGTELVSIQKTQLTCALGLGDTCDPATSPVIVGPDPATDPVSGFVGGSGPASDRTVLGQSGVLVEYVNRPVVGGGEGCTPGYWKQDQHFDSYPAPYLPTSTVGSLGSAELSAAYGAGTTFLAMLNNNGNRSGLEALGRHLIAAILNAANPDVSYDLTVAQIISGFETVYPGSKDAYNAYKNTLAGFNEQGCPLN